jgi:heme O synthase-like polyprenyltransferase
MFGFIAATDSINSQIILPALGILLLACGSAALNHYQERKTDVLMDRTKNRPIHQKNFENQHTNFAALVASLISFIGDP